MATNGEFIEFLSESALKDLRTGNAELITMISNVEKVGSVMQKIKMPSTSDGAVKNLSNDIIRLDKASADLQIKLQKLAQAQTQSAIKTNQLESSTIRLNKAKDLSIKQIERENAKIEASVQIYNKVQAKLNLLSNEYKNLAVKKELTGKLTDKESQRYDFLSGKITKYDATLKAVDASMGKYQRNVGNYAGAFNPLSNSINQLTREMPAFANSVQTGFMAISNNLPIFFDAMQQAIAQQKALQAEGKPSLNALQVLAGGFFTLGTALSVGVTLLTVFGPKIADAIFNTDKKKKADEEATKAIEEKNKAEQEYIDTMTKSGSEEISRSQILFENAKNVNISMRDRLSYVKELKDRYPDYLGHLSNEAILSGNTALAEERLNEALMKRGIAIALQTKLGEKYNELTSVLLKINDVQSKSSLLTKEEIELGKKLGVSNAQLLKDKQLISNLTLARYAKEKAGKEGEIKGIFDLYNQYSPYLKVVNESTKAIENKTKAVKEEEQVQKNSQIAFEKNIAVLETQLAGIDRTSESYDTLNGILQLQKGIYDQLFGTVKEGQKEVIDGLELTDEAVYADYYAWLKLKDATDAYLKTFSDSYLSNAGLGSFQKFFDGTFNKLLEGADTTKEKFAVTFEAISESAKEAFAFISEASNANFENEYSNLQKQKDIAILFAGDSASAKKEIDRQYDIEQRRIKNREAKAQKNQALFNIAISTAQGVVSALASTPPNVPLSIAIGAIGLLQAGIVAGKEVPKYWKGTDNHTGGLMEINDQKGNNFKEIVQTPDGKMRIYNERNKILNAPKGTKVINADLTKQMMFDGNLNNILQSNGIDYKGQGTIIDLSKMERGISELKEVVKNKTETKFQFDRSGFNHFVKEGNTTKENLNNRVVGKGKSV